jgi:hypothetical protein
VFKTIWNPDFYHGTRKKKDFFEGWYYKIVDRDCNFMFSFIPGVLKAKSIYQSESFLQVLDGKNNKSYYLKYGIDSFKAEKGAFNFSIGKNSFSLKELKLNHYDDELQMLGTLNFVDLIQWPDSKLSPGSMGFYNYLTFMECYSQVCALDGNIIGKLLINNQEIDFTGGKVYIEKNWGKNFPKSYIWLQSNHFSSPGISFTCSIARIPFKLFTFSGFLAAFVFENQVYKFTTMNRTKLTKEIDDQHITLNFINKQTKLIVETEYQDTNFIVCKGPNPGNMNTDVRESINGIIKIQLIDLHKEKILYSGTGECSGIELMGNLKTL